MLPAPSRLKMEDSMLNFSQGVNNIFLPQESNRGRGTGQESFPLDQTPTPNPFREKCGAGQIWDFYLCAGGIQRIRGRHVKNFGKNYFFSKICAIMPSTRQFGYKRGNLSRLNSVGWLPKTIFALRRANLPHNLG